MPYHTRTVIQAAGLSVITDAMRDALRSAGFRIVEGGFDLVAEFRGTVPCNWLAEVQQCAELLGVTAQSVRLIHRPEGEDEVREVYGKQPAHAQIADWAADWIEQHFAKLSDSQRAALRIALEPGAH